MRQAVICFERTLFNNTMHSYVCSVLAASEMILQYHLWVAERGQGEDGS